MNPIQQFLTIIATFLSERVVEPVEQLAIFLYTFGYRTLAFEVLERHWWATRQNRVMPGPITREEMNPELEEQLQTYIKGVLQNMRDAGKAAFTATMDTLTNPTIGTLVQIEKNLYDGVLYWPAPSPELIATVNGDANLSVPELELAFARCNLAVTDANSKQRFHGGIKAINTVEDETLKGKLIDAFISSDGVDSAEWKAACWDMAVKSAESDPTTQPDTEFLAGLTKEVQNPAPSLSELMALFGARGNN